MIWFDIAWILMTIFAGAGYVALCAEEAWDQVQRRGRRPRREAPAGADTPPVLLALGGAFGLAMWFMAMAGITMIA